MMRIATAALIAQCTLSIALQVPLSAPHISRSLITPEIDTFVNSLLAEWNSSGLAVAVVRRDPSSTDGWLREFGSYGIAKADGSRVTPDTMFGIASNSKLFLSLSVGLLINNKTLAAERGQQIKWATKAKALIPEWGLMDEEMDRGVSLQDMLSHRTGMPRHDMSGQARKGGVPEMVRHLFIFILEYLPDSHEDIDYAVPPSLCRIPRDFPV